jgi:hypothetical protein
MSLGDVLTHMCTQHIPIAEDGIYAVKDDELDAVTTEECAGPSKFR